jgi:hypothetical protein
MGIASVIKEISERVKLQFILNIAVIKQIYAQKVTMGSIPANKLLSSWINLKTCIPHFMQAFCELYFPVEFPVVSNTFLYISWTGTTIEVTNGIRHEYT